MVVSSPVETRRNGHISTLTTALIYTRVSSDDQAREGVSLDTQLDECRRYANQQGWVLGSEYQDVMTGRRDDRPKYQALLADIRQMRADGQWVVVVVAALDRFGRKLLERVRCREELKDLGVSVHSVRDGGEVSDLVANVLAAVAQEEVRRHSERVRAARQYITANGWHAVGKAAWGYRWRSATADERAMGAPNSVLEIDPTTAPYVVEAFQRVANGAGIRRVERWLTSLPSEARGGRVLNYRAVQRLLKAAVYVGRQQQGDADMLERPQGRWPALVDDGTWLHIQAQIKSHRRMPHQASGDYLLTGLLRCPKCGQRMSGAGRRRSKRTGAPLPRYCCIAEMLGPTAPDPACRYSVKGGPVDTAVLDATAAIVETATSSDPHVKKALLRAWTELQQPKGIGDATKRIRRLQHDGERARKRLADAAIKLVDGELDKLGYTEMRRHVEADLGKIEVELERLRVSMNADPQLPPLEQVLRDGSEWAIALREGDTRMQREVLSHLVSKVVPVRIGYGKYQADITWTPLGNALRQTVSVMASYVAA